MHKVRARHERPADGKHLLLAAGERAGELAAALAQDREGRRTRAPCLRRPGDVRSCDERAELEVLMERTSRARFCAPRDSGQCLGARWHPNPRRGSAGPRS